MSKAAKFDKKTEGIVGVKENWHRQKINQGNT
jgi:hypothetical protein